MNTERAPLARPRRPWGRCDPRDREYFDILGDGLVVVWPPPLPMLQGPGSG